MTTQQINNLVANGIFPNGTGNRELIETHISWVILHDGFVYKIKKPVHYSFLDFSSIKKRRHFCTREIILNKRLAENIYLDVQPVRDKRHDFAIGGKSGTVIDYTVRMNRVEKEKQMDKMLAKNTVTNTHIKKLAEKIASFHTTTKIINKKKVEHLQKDFNDLGNEKAYLSIHLGSKYNSLINHALETSDSFLCKNKILLQRRLQNGFFRDCHGDLHSRNIFLLPEPVPFDCIEFNDEFRQIDVLNEIAFLCMDLDAFGRRDLSELFVHYYNQFFPVMKTADENNLFIYYKSYRANIRAKVNSLRARSSQNDHDKKKALVLAKKYLHLMNGYIKVLKT